MARVFFTVEDWDLWGLILASHSLHDPQFHLEEAAREAFRRFDLMAALKTVLLLRRSEDKSLHHYLRPLYSSAEALSPVLQQARLLRDMASEVLAGSSRVTQHNLSVVYQLARKAAAEALADSHMTVLEATQLKAFNALETLDGLLKQATQQGLLPEQVQLLVLQVAKRLRDLEHSLQCVQNCGVLLVCEYLKTAYGVCPFDFK